MTDDYSPRYVGDLSHPLEHTFVDGNGKPHDLSGVNAANMTFVLVNADSGVRKVGMGSSMSTPLVSLRYRPECPLLMGFSISRLKNSCSKRRCDGGVCQIKGGMLWYRLS